MSGGPEHGIVAPSFDISRILEEQRRQDEKRRVKRAANRRSASTSRARKKAFLDDMTAKNERMRQHALILSMLPDLVVAVCRSGEMTYVSPACEWLLLHSPEEVMGANIFELVTQDCHDLLRKMISENLSRPVQSLRDQSESGIPSDEVGDRSDSSLNSRGTVWRSPTQLSAGAAQAFTQRGDKSPGENHRDRVQQRYRPAQAAPGAANSGKEIIRHGNGRVAAPPSKNPDMLRLIRCDKTTVWCESRLSVRKAKSDSPFPIPVEIILTLRTVSEGKKTSVSQGLPGALVPIHGRVRAMDLVHDVDGMEDDNTAYVEDDDDGYRCEEDEDSNNSGSGNDYGARLDNSKGKGVERNVVTKPTEDEEEDAKDEAGSGAILKARVEQTLSNKRKRVEDPESAESAANNKSGEEDSSTGGDTSGSTTQEGSGSCSMEADSNGEGSNSGSKWGDGCAGDRGFNDASRCAEYGASEDGSSDMSSAATDSGEEVQIQNAVQSLMRVRYSEEAAP